MIVTILQHTPGWVWGLLIALLTLGLLQTRTREVSRARVIALPVAMIVLALIGLLGAFGSFVVAYLAWAGGFALAARTLGAAAAVRGARWSGATGRILVPGSWLPLGLILGVFLTRYVANVCLALDPALARNTVFAAACGLAYGGFSGLFWSRARSLRGSIPGWRAVAPA